MNELDELKSLLFGAEKQALDSIAERVQKPETRAVDVADVLPEAIRLSHKKGGELVANLRGPVGQCLRESFQEQPQEYADALYPVMGPAIRKYIVNTLRAFAQQLNETVEQSMSVRGLKWRFQAWQSGVPFGEYVILRTLLYRVEQAYLISRENGLLIGHVHHTASRIKDSDAVSAMFTAIQDFVKESFSPDRSGRLETADMGEFTLWAVHGPHALLVCVIRGVPPASLRADLSAILERIHFRYGERIREYAGDTSTTQGLEEELNDCIRLEARIPKDEKKRRLSPVLLFVLLLFAGALIYLGIGNWLAWRQQTRLAAVLDSTPGVFVSGIERDGRTFTLHGLRDPLSSSIETVAENAGLDADQIIARFRPYRSLEPEMRVERARVLLEAPPTVSVEALEQVLVLSGTASQGWIDRVRSKVAAGVLEISVSLEGVQSLDLLQLQNDVADAREAHFYFSDGTTLAGPDVANLREHAAKLRGLIDRAQRLETSIAIGIAGFTDGTGPPEFNSNLAAARAEIAAQALLENGIAESNITRLSDLSAEAPGMADPNLRRVTIYVTAGSAAGAGSSAE